MHCVASGALCLTWGCGEDKGPGVSPSTSTGGDAGTSAVPEIPELSASCWAALREGPNDDWPSGLCPFECSSTRPRGATTLANRLGTA
jgi:hypothetical protein